MNVLLLGSKLGLARSLYIVIRRCQIHPTIHHTQILCRNTSTLGIAVDQPATSSQMFNLGRILPPLVHHDTDCKVPYWTLGKWDITSVISRWTFGKGEEWRKGKGGISMRRSPVRKGSLWFEKDKRIPVFPLFVVFDHPSDFQFLSSLSSVHIEKSLWFSQLPWSSSLRTTHFVGKG